MSIFSGSTPIVDVQSGATPVNAVYSGSDLVWERINYLLDYPSFPASQAERDVISLNETGPFGIGCERATDAVAANIGWSCANVSSGSNVGLYWTIQVEAGKTYNFKVDVTGMAILTGGVTAAQFCIDSSISGQAYFSQYTTVTGQNREIIEGSFVPTQTGNCYIHHMHRQGIGLPNNVPYVGAFYAIQVWTGA